MPPVFRFWVPSSPKGTPRRQRGSQTREPTPCGRHAHSVLLLPGTGIPVTMIERATDVVLDYRASTFHPPTLELLEESGITAALVAMGLECPTVQIRDREIGKVAEFDVTRLRNETRHPYRLQCEQFKLVGFLYEALEKIAGIDLRFGHEVVDIS